MTSKERLLTALDKGIPDRLPVTVHQWQPYHFFHAPKENILIYAQAVRDLCNYP